MEARIKTKIKIIIIKITKIKIIIGIGIIEIGRVIASKKRIRINIRIKDLKRILT